MNQKDVDESKFKDAIIASLKIIYDGQLPLQFTRKELHSRNIRSLVSLNNDATNGTGLLPDTESAPGGKSLYLLATVVDYCAKNRIIPGVRRKPTEKQKAAREQNCAKAHAKEGQAA